MTEGELTLSQFNKRFYILRGVGRLHRHLKAISLVLVTISFMLFNNCSGFEGVQNLSQSSLGAGNGDGNGGGKDSGNGDNNNDGNGVGSDGPRQLPPAKPFSISRQNVKLLPFTARVSKLKYVTGDIDQSLFANIESNRLRLGDYNHSQGVDQELSWSKARMETWIKALEPVCSTKDLQRQFASNTGFQDFLKKAYGRNLSADDLTLINEVNQVNADSSEKFQVLCLVTLSSLEFLAL